MAKSIRTFILSVIIVSILSSCGFGTSTTATEETPLLIAQPTASLAEIVKVELSVQADTSIPFNTVGQLIKYNYTIKMIQNGSSDVPANITVNGTTLTCPAINTIGNLNERLDQDEIIVCTTNYSITQPDLNNGSVTNVSIATVYGVNSNQVTTTVNTIQPVILKVTKTANPITYDRIGQTITYTYVITNNGTTTLGPAQFTVTDAGITTPINCGDASLTLASNATATCSATYTVSQADMNATSVATNATVAGGGVTSSQPASATITKSTTALSPANLTVGSTIKHTVSAGDWLWQIARCYGADPIKVSEANPPTPGEISPATTVTVPNIGSVGKIYGPPCTGTHTVQSGDTWNSIALKYNADVTVLQMVNSNTLAVGTILKVPLNSASTTTATAITSNCVEITRNIKVTGTNSGTTRFNICGQTDSSGKMKIATIGVSQRTSEVGASAILQDITVSITTSTAVNDTNSFIIQDMNYDGNDDFRIVEFLPAGPNIPYLYYIYDLATNKFIYNESYRKITSPEFPGNNEIRSQWRESATKWGIDTYTIANNTPKLIKRETWEAINATQAKHQVTTFNADGTSQVTLDETVPLP